jgi:esterase/lipase superfamily enzyme
MATTRYARTCTMIVAFLLTSVALEAQRLALMGRVTDETGAALPGVTVELVREGKTERTGTTDADGVFDFALVELSEAGVHEVRILLPGFAPATVRLRSDRPRITERVGSFQVEVRLDTLATAAPGPPDSRPVQEPPPAGGDGENHAVVPVFYATDRNRLSYQPLAYGPDREASARLHLGRIDVSVPRDHRVGQLERPTIWTFWREDPAKHFVIVRGQEQTYEAFYRGLADTVARSRRREALVFVHGFNVTFESAVYRTAQIAYDLGFDGAPILYSWPSLGSATAYPVDANNSEWTIDRLRYFLEDVAAKSGASYVHLIAHSRGNWPLVNALTGIANGVRATPRPRFSQIVLTAPDVDADRFRQLAAAFRAIAERTTLYASANDEALALSRRFQGYQRAGDVFPQIVTVDGIDSIDVSAVDTSFLGHSYYGDNTSVVSDIRRLLQTGLSPDRRCGLQSVTSAALRYWTFIAKAICPL